MDDDHGLAKKENKDFKVLVKENSEKDGSDKKENNMDFFIYTGKVNLPENLAGVLVDNKDDNINFDIPDVKEVDVVLLTGAFEVKIEDETNQNVKIPNEGA